MHKLYILSIYTAFTTRGTTNCCRRIQYFEVIIVILNRIKTLLLFFFIHFYIKRLIRVFWRPKCSKIWKFSSISTLKLIFINVLKYLTLLAFINKNSPFSLTFCKEEADNLPDIADTLWIEEKCLLSSATIKEIHQVESFIK